PGSSSVHRRSGADRSSSVDRELQSADDSVDGGEVRDMDQPRKHESTKKTVYTEKTWYMRDFVSSCFRGLILLVVVSRGLDAATPLDSIVDRAVQIQVSLSHDKLDGVATNATAITTDAQALGKPGEKIAAGALALQKAKKIDEARTAFGQM